MKDSFRPVPAQSRYGLIAAQESRTAESVRRSFVAVAGLRARSRRDKLGCVEVFSPYDRRADVDDPLPGFRYPVRALFDVLKQR
jgi:hypothetical protein